ncbi:hypothetical protein NQ315_011584 [Exocentrus adspersus]|uniref:Peptidase S1 domain-containing protein n=1 Tax=Exocentrus adspersus TaxID=1586481 RepID=A0AAV8VW38_9CUCU|nr:hypothetical protein NQ315_011584 [Exocentrus adspersus]
MCQLRCISYSTRCIAVNMHISSIFLLVFVGCSLALRTSNVSWDAIKGKNLHADPISNSTVDKQNGGRIIGGNEVVPNSRPYQVALLIDGRSFCTGSLISSTFVVTAAHCTYNCSYVDLIFGAHNINIQEATQVRVTSSNIIVHPDFMRPDRRSNDISLIRIPSPIVSNSYIRIVDMARAEDGFYVGSTAVLSGWGTTSDTSSSISSELREVYLTVMDNTDCVNVYGPGIVKSSNICTSGRGAVGGCNGDSGGPLVVDNVQIGVTSFISSRGCESGDPTGYARISHYRAWIDRNINL